MGHEQEVKFDYYKTFDGWVGHNYWPAKLPDLDSNVINDTAVCNEVFRNIYTNYDCDVDFKKYSIAYVAGYVRQVFTYEFQTRVLVNHKAKTYKVELRAYTKTCNSGMNSNYNDYHTRQFLKIPKVPEGYTYSVHWYGPVYKMQ